MHHAPLIVCTTRVLPRRVHYAPLIACVSYLELRALSASDATHCVHYAPLIVYDCVHYGALTVVSARRNGCRGPPGRRGWKGSMMDLSLELLGGFSMVSDVTMASHSVPNISHTNRPGVHNACRVGLELRTSDVLRGRPRFESCPNSLAEVRSGVDLGRAPNPPLVCTTEAHACRTAAVGVPPHAACHQIR